MVERQPLLQKIKKYFSLKNKNVMLIFCVIIVGLIVILGFGNVTKKSTNKEKEDSQITYTFDALEYSNQVGANLQNVINNIKGISNAKVVVVVQQSPKIEYLTEQSDKGSAVVYVKNGSAYQPVIVTQFLPQITGVLVVANGVSNLQTKNNLINAISSVYNLNISCIDILEGK